MINHRETILNLLAKATSASPVSAADLRSQSNIPDQELDSALYDLYENKIINHCYITKNGHTDNMYWPTAIAYKPTFNGRQIVSRSKPLARPRRDDVKPIIAPTPVIAEETTPMQNNDAIPHKSKADLIRSTIRSHPGITHESLIAAVTNSSQDEIEIKKAEDMVIYILKQGSFTKHSNIHLDSKKITKTYYSDHDYVKFKERNAGSINNDIPTLAQHHAVEIADKKPTALDVQEGGSHYKNMAIQPVQYIMANNLGFVEGNIIKYVSRYKNKNGVEDLKKARHFLDILIEQQI